MFGKLREHELELGRLNEEEDERRKKYVDLKFEISKGKSHVEKNDSDYENENLMKKKFIKFIKNKNKSQHKNYKKENQNFVSTSKCYGCKEISHVKSGSKERQEIYEEKEGLHSPGIK